MQAIIISRDVMTKWMMGGVAAALILFVSGYSLGRHMANTEISLSQSTLADVSSAVHDNQQEASNTPPQIAKATEKAKVIAPTKSDPEPASKPSPTPTAQTTEEHTQSDDKADDGLKEVPGNRPSTSSFISQRAEPPTVENGFALQVGAFGSLKNADKYLMNLLENDADAFVFEDQNPKSKLKFTVRIGFYERYAEALEAAKAYQAIEGKSVMVVNRSLAENPIVPPNSKPTNNE